MRNLGRNPPGKCTNRGNIEVVLGVRLPVLAYRAIDLREIARAQRFSPSGLSQHESGCARLENSKRKNKHPVSSHELVKLADEVSIFWGQVCFGKHSGQAKSIQST